MIKVLIILPCFNEAATIRKTILELKAVITTTTNIVYTILVVNDCSTDNSIVEIEKTNTNFIDLPINLGIGGAMQAGYLYARKNNYDIAVQFDGDGQHDPSYITDLIQPIINKETNVVIGSRFLKKEGFQSSFLRRLGIKYFSWLNNVLVNLKISDSTSGFRAFDSKTIACVCDYYPENYPEPEAIIFFAKKEFKILEVPVQMRARTGGKSSISGWNVAFYMFKVTVASIFLYIRMKLSKSS